MPSPLPRRALALSATLFAAACTAPPAASGPGAAAEIVPVDVTQAQGRNAYLLSWETATPADAKVLYGEAGTLDHVAVGTSSEDGLQHEVHLFGLAGGSTWSAQATSDGDGITYEGDVVELTPAAPPADLPSLELVTAPSDSVTGFSLTMIVQYPAGVIALLDRQGRYVWWQDVPSIGAYRAIYDPQANTVSWLATSGTGSTLWRCALDGQPEAVATLPLTHHDFTVDPAGGWYVLGYDDRDVPEVTDDSEEGGDSARTDGATVTVRGDQLYHVTADGSEITSVWSSWDEFPYAGESMSNGVVLEYPHTNSVTVDPDTGHVLLSLYLADALAMVDPATGLAEWTMGGESSTWTMLDGEAFAHQHSPVLLEGGSRLALFDNGAGSEADPAEAAIYDLDWASKVATRSFRYDDGGIHTQVTTGSAVPSGDDGSMLVAWGSDATLTQVSASGEVEMEVLWHGDLFGYTAHLAELAGAAW